MMGDLLQLFAHGCGKWVTSCMRWEVGGWQAPKISTCIWEASIGLYHQQTRSNQVD